VLCFAHQEGKTKGWAYLVVLVAGEGPEDGLGTWLRAAATVAQSSPRETEGESAHAGGLMEEERAGMGCRIYRQTGVRVDQRAPAGLCDPTAF
jgi:hypothetical protein